MTTEQQGNTQQSWLATVTFAFVAMYTHMSLGISVMSIESIVFFVAGLLSCRLLLDIPAQLLQRLLYSKETQGLSGEAYRQGADKAAAMGTFIKAGQVIIALAATKYSYPFIF